MQTQTAQQVYSTSVVVLPASEQLRLATLILEGLTESSAATLDFSEQWSDEDIQDVTSYCAKYAGGSLDQE